MRCWPPATPSRRSRCRATRSRSTWPRPARSRSTSSRGAVLTAILRREAGAVVLDALAELAHLGVGGRPLLGARSSPLHPSLPVHRRPPPLKRIRRGCRRPSSTVVSPGASATSSSRRHPHRRSPPPPPSARPRARRRERRAEAGGEIADPERGGAAAEIAARRDPVHRRRGRHRLGHGEVRGLEHALGDAERDPVDEQLLPERKRRRRRLLQPREVGQVAAERRPALGLELGLGRAPPPQPRAA